MCRPQLGELGVEELLTPLATLRWRHHERDSVSNHQPHDCLLDRLFRRRSKKSSKLRVTGLCAGNSPGTGEFPAQLASCAENVSIWWRHHVTNNCYTSTVTQNGSRRGKCPAACSLPFTIFMVDHANPIEQQIAKRDYVYYWNQHLREFNDVWRPCFVKRTESLLLQFIITNYCMILEMCKHCVLYNGSTLACIDTVVH